MKFPMRAQFANAEAHVEALSAHGKLTDKRVRGLKRLVGLEKVELVEMPQWAQDGKDCVFAVSGRLPWPRDLEPAYNNLVGVSMENEKRIVRAAKGEMRHEGENCWFIVCLCVPD